MVRPLRILCLPGWRTSSAAMRAQLVFSSFEKNLKGEVTFLPIDPALPASGPPQSIVQMLDSTGPYFQWWYTQHGDNPVYEGIEESVQYVIDTLQKQGPIDGLLGFSQGAAMVHYLTALQATGDPHLKGMFQFAILVSGFLPQDSRYETMLPTSRVLNLPSLHVYGKEDELYSHCCRAATFYNNPVIIDHSRGHSFPKLGKYDTRNQREN
ncbi:putative Ovarian cancer-associated 2 protein-like protein [Cardiosporidium cionae]|uniref:Ovarian cancer-associated 2 protein-like protein n=1 Tax=Cardiosporidium cionae TaxID=476202 RepID=A0ABQ7JBZ9_9APIC|nr:putative Ovarian cancer-associated 2 protein-like protein [Cardiosporidium cionae]|eukprot:KAF8821514.1 putative Ovarian cancer-associated 2 protein-like protein [Cardiosporidium cionae]